MAASAGETLLLGIALDLDPSGAVRGIRMIDNSMRNFQQNTQRNAQSFAQNLQNTMRAASQAAGGALTVGLGAIGAGESMRRLVLNPMLENAEQFGVELSRLQFVSGAVGDELQTLRELALTTGVETQFSPTEAIGGLRRLRSAGLETNEAMRELRSALDLATASAGTLDLDRATLSTAAAIAQFRHQFRNAGSDIQAGRVIMDNWAQTARETAFDISEIPEVMRSLRGMANIWKVNANEVFGLAGVLRSSGLQAADATDALAGMGRRFAIVMRQVKAAEGGGVTRRGRRVVEAFRQFGVEIFDEQTRQTRKFSDVVVELIDAYNRFGTDETKITALNTLLGQQAGNIVAAGSAFRRYGLEGGDAVRELIRRIGDSEGASRQAAESFENTLAGMKVFVVGSLQTIAVVLGQALEPAMRLAINLTRDFVNGFLGFVRAYPRIATVIAFAILGFTLITLAIGGVIVGLSGLALVLSMVIGAFASAATAGLTFAGVMSVITGVLLPLLAIVAVLGAGFIAIVAVFALLAVAYERNLGGIKDFIDDWVTDLQLIWTALVDWFSSDQQSIATALKEQLEERGIAGGFLVITGLIVRLQVVWKGIMKSLGAAWGVFAAVFGAVLGVIVKGIDWLEETLASFGFRFDTNMEKWEMAGKIIGGILVAGIGLAIVAIGNLAIVALALAVAFAIPLLGFLLFVGVIALVIFGIAKLFSWLKKGAIAIKNWFVEAMQPFVKFVEVLQEIWERASKADSPFRKNLLNLYVFWTGVFLPIELFFRRFGEVIVKVWETIARGVGIWANAWGTILRPIINALLAVGRFIISWWAFLFNGWTSAWARVGSIFSTAGKTIVHMFREAFSRAWEGVRNVFQNYVADISDLLPQSDAKVGPLSNLSQSGESLWNTWMGGVQTGFPSMISGIGEMVGQVASRLTGDSPVQGATPATSTGETGIVPTGGSRRSISLSFGNMTFNIQQATPEEAERLATMIMERIRRELEQQEEVSFA